MRIECTKLPTDKHYCVCEQCGYSVFVDSPTLNHECHKSACMWEPLGAEWRCTKCEIVLPTRVNRRCQKSAGLQGLGDVVHAVAGAMGFEQKEGCGCGQTQEMLNEILPFVSKEKGEQE